ncbi:PAS domain S-box protein [Massilia arenosa]|uniref:Sensor protein FixL n=1 Tax=Zemynaea arenosa TaxID=2561931 RepID=A0A4Y9SGV1_9BURK|nr:PAS domain S-box protein [Massilia arenosa]TFW23574.1 PAS domain S-box protein [Massilia arenosa]
MDTEVLKTQSLAWLLSAATDPMLIADEAGLIVLANDAAHRLFGYAPPALSGQAVEILVPEGVAGDHARLRGSYAEQPRARPMGKGLELQARHSAGYLFPVEVSLSPLETPDGARLVMATIHDISARKRYETALLESEERMRAVFETAVDAIITIDERGMVERMNPAAQRIFGWTEAEVSGKNIKMLMPSPDRERHDGYLHHYISTGEKRIIGKGREVKGLRKDGTVFPMDLAVAEMHISGKRMFTGLVRDITERKQAEERNAALLAELTSANEELTNFAYVVSHDLKAPLRAIGSLADWLATDYADKFNDEGKEHMRLLINRVHRMAALIDGILQYSRVGRVREAGAAIDLNRVLAEVVDLLAPPPHIQVRVQADLPTVTAEPTRIHQLFHNLLSNAIKYMDKPEGEVDVTFEDAGAEWHFQVRDNGPGIEARHFERIFQLFQTLAPRDRVESTGVGLALVKKIVEMYGGRVWVESVVRQGTAFHFTLPKTQPTGKLE